MKLITKSKTFVNIILCCRIYLNADNAVPSWQFPQGCQIKDYQPVVVFELP